MEVTLKSFNKSVAISQSKVLLSTFSRRVESIEKINMDWAHWDDAYKFVQDQNIEFKNTNLIDETLQNANLNLILFFDKSGFPVFKKSVALKGVGSDSIPSEVLTHTQDASKIDIKGDIREVKQQSGLLHTSAGTYLFSITPILTSEGKGPAMGALMMARYINSSDKEELLKSTGLEVEFIDIQNFDSNRYDGITMSQLESGLVIREKGNYNDVYVLVKDSFGNKAQILNYRYELMGLKDGANLTLYLTLVSIPLSLLFAYLLSISLVKTQKAN
jgi:sensor domain CHASE-containing protein